MNVICFTSFTFSYLDRARVLFQSVRQHHPEWRTVALVTDRAPAEINFRVEIEPFDELVYSHELGIANFDGWLFKHDIIEICTAVKGPFLRSACESGADVVIYLDPDTCLFSRVDPVLELLRDYNIVLTPHLLSPEVEQEAILDNERSASRTGIYNLGFLAIRTDGEGRKFADWWRDRLLAFCYDDIPSGLFVDQRWCDHVPALFERVHILRDPGFNVASWNIGHRRLTISHDGKPYINGKPLRFWHFTKLGPIGDAMTRKYATDNFEVHEIWKWYRAAVNRAKVDQLPQKYWAFSVFENGKTIERSFRLMYRERSDLQKAFPYPFHSGPNTYYAWLEAEGLIGHL